VVGKAPQRSTSQRVGNATLKGGEAPGEQAPHAGQYVKARATTRAARTRPRCVGPQRSSTRAAAPTRHLSATYHGPMEGEGGFAHLASLVIPCDRRRSVPHVKRPHKRSTDGAQLTATVAVAVAKRQYGPDRRQQGLQSIVGHDGCVRRKCADGLRRHAILAVGVHKNRAHSLNAAVQCASRQAPALGHLRQEAMQQTAGRHRRQRSELLQRDFFGPSLGALHARKRVGNNA
jgi:hypothetical protein